MSGRLIVLTLVSTFGAAGVLTARADLPPSLPPLVTPETQDAIDLGLEYLARMQSRDGAWRHSGSWGGRYPTAMTALSGLTMLANGNTATQGKYAQNVSRAANFLIASAQPSGLIAREEEADSSMHGHGFAMLFLGQLYGMEEDNEKQERIAAVLRRAVELTARSQSRRGGWIYRPDSSDDEGSVTVTQLQGLRASRNVGITVPKQVIDQAMKYLDMSTLPDGGISYRADRQGGSRPPITAAAVACWYNAGLYDYPSAVKAIDYCKQRVGNGEARIASFSGHYYYAHLYMAQIMWLSNKENWEWYFPTMRDWLIAQQAPDGSWEDHYVGKVYATAIATFILQIPYGYLPILQR